MHFLFQQKQRVIHGQRFGSFFPLYLLFHPCWTILVGHISSVKWTGAQRVISCFWSNHCFRNKFQLVLGIVHPLCASIRGLRPTVVLILILPRRSSKSNDSARILTYPPFGCDRKSWSKNQFMLISACTSQSSRNRGSSTSSGLGASFHCICCFTRAGPFLLGTFPRWSGLVFNQSHCVLVPSLYLILNLAFQAHLWASHHNIPFSCFEWICDDRHHKKCGLISIVVIAFFWNSGFTLIPFRKFRVQQKSHLLQRYLHPTWFIFQLLIDSHDFSYLLHQYCSVTFLGSSIFPAYCGITLVKTMTSSLSPLVYLRLSHSWHLLLLRLGFSMKPPWQCLHFTRICVLCYHPSLSNSGSVSGHHLVGNNRTGCWSSFISFIASSSSVQCFHPWYLPSHSYWFWIWNSTMLSRPSPLLRAHQPLYILHWFYKTSHYVVCTHS